VTRPHHHCDNGRTRSLVHMLSGVFGISFRGVLAGRKRHARLRFINCSRDKNLVSKPYTTSVKFVKRAHVLAEKSHVIKRLQLYPTEQHKSRQHACNVSSKYHCNTARLNGPETRMGYSENSLFDVYLWNISDSV